MFRVSIAPITRSTSNCNCSFWYPGHITYQGNDLPPAWPKLLYMFRVSIAPIMSTSNCNCSFWYPGHITYQGNDLMPPWPKLLYMFRVSIAPIIRNTSNCNCSFWYPGHITYQGNDLPPAWPKLLYRFWVSVAPIIRSTSNLPPAWPLGHTGGRLLPWYMIWPGYQKLQLQFDVLLMMGAIDTRNM